MDGPKLFFNGVNGPAGSYLADPLTLSEVAALALGETPRPALRRRLKERLGGVFLGLPYGSDPKDLAQAGWAVVFHEKELAAVRSALAPLIEHRRRQAGEVKTRVLSYRAGDDVRSWLTHHGVAWGTVSPEKVPYYLLLVGGPEKIPFDFQYLLAVEYAVGRLGFDDPDDYRRYAEGLIARETARGGPPTAAFFATRHDRATELSDEHLAGPLAAALAAAGVEIASRRGRDATRDRLAELLHPTYGEAPDLLFAASHGLGWSPGDSRQEAWQGALLCQDWSPGEKVDEERHLFGAQLLDDGARVHGLVAFLFACYGAGTPERDSYPPRPGAAARRLARRPFLAALPRRLLAHPGGAALAVIGHVDRAWSYSFAPPAAGPQIQPFVNTLRALLAGEGVGHAVRDFRQRYAALAVEVSRRQDTGRWGPGLPAAAREPLARTWLERNDAESYVVLGDPAARLRIS